jgi:hypothetical protein
MSRPSTTALPLSCALSLSEGSELVPLVFSGPRVLAVDKGGKAMPPPPPPFASQRPAESSEEESNVSVCGGCKL